MTKILFTAVSAHGHVLPLGPLMQAALDDGHDVALIASEGLRGLVESELPAGVTLLAAGPMPFELATTAAERTGGDVMQPSIEGIGETFGGVLVDLSLPEALPLARAWQPDVVVADQYNTVGPLIAAIFDVPWYRYAMSVHPPQSWTEAIDASAASRYESYETAPVAPQATLLAWPSSLTDSGDAAWTDAPVHEIAFTAHVGRSGGDVVDAADAGRTADASEAQPKVLATFGTIFSDAASLERLASSLDGIDTVITRGLALGETTAGDETTGSVQWAEFEPIGRLLEGVDLTVSAGGAGTVLASLSRGVPLVLWPQGADQPHIAEQVVRAGAGVTIASLDDTRQAVDDVLRDPRFAERAAAIADENRSRPQPREVLGSILQQTSRLS